LQAGFLSESQAYFTLRGNEWACLQTTEATSRLEGLVTHEGELLAFMHATTAPKLWAALDAAAIAPHAEALLEQEAAGLRRQLTRWDSEPESGPLLRDIERSHRVLCRVKGASPRFAALLKAHLVQQVCAAATRAAQWLERRANGVCFSPVLTHTTASLRLQFDALMDSRIRRASEKVFGGGGDGAVPGGEEGAAGAGAGAAAGASSSRAAPPSRGTSTRIDADDPLLVGPLVEYHFRYKGLVEAHCGR